MAFSRDGEETNEDSEALANEELRDTSVREALVAEKVSVDTGTTVAPAGSSSNCRFVHFVAPR